MTLSTADARLLALAHCEHPDEYRRAGNHRDMTSRFVFDDLNPDALYCLRCEQEIPA